MTGYFSCVPLGLAWQYAAKGQISHLAILGVQTMEPMSMSAWLKSPGFSSEISSLSFSSNIFREAALEISDSISNNRLVTRIKFPSMAGSGKPKEIEAIAAAV